MHKQKEISQEHEFNTLNLVENKSLTQREISKNLDLSLGTINFIIKSLIRQGMIKAHRFKNSNHKSAYLYYLTPKGMEQKIQLTKAFLQRKIDEYNRLQKEIQKLQDNLKNS